MSSRNEWLSLILVLHVPFPVLGADFTNSATLAITLSDSNLVLGYSCANTNGAITVFQSDRLDAPLSEWSILDSRWIPSAGEGQLVLPDWRTNQQRFFRILLEPFLTRGRALVFKDGPLDFAAMRALTGDITTNTPMIFKQPQEVWLEELGDYDTNSVLIGSNSGFLSGKYAFTAVDSIERQDLGFEGIPRVQSPSNDFRIWFFGNETVDQRRALLWSSEVQFFHDIHDYRNRFLNDPFIEALHLPADLEENLKLRHFRPDLNMEGYPPPKQRPALYITERFISDSFYLFPVDNIADAPVRTRGPREPHASLLPLSMAYDSDLSIGEYAFLAAFCILGTNGGFPFESGFSLVWQTNMLPALNDGITAWVSYRYSGNAEVHRYAWYAYRMWNNRSCGGSDIPCDKGGNLRNVMMFDEGNVSGDGVFPFRSPAGKNHNDGPTGSDLSAFHLAAIFYDIAHEAGLGIHKADLLIWKTITLITDNRNFPMRAFGAKIQEAARALWPDPRSGRSGLSLYEEDINAVLTSRGIPLSGVLDFRSNLPSAFAVSSSFLERTNLNERGFASGHPMTQPSVNSYGQFSGNFNGYAFTNTSVQYVAYQFYKFSKVGPADVVGLTDGSFNPTTGNWNGDGSYHLELPDRAAGNLIVLAPGRTIRWVWKGVRASNEVAGYYPEDVRPFGFRVIKATPNGFSFTANALSETTTNKTYELKIADPSLDIIGPATYEWTVTDCLGTSTSAAGTNAQITVTKDEPFTLHIARTRIGQVDTLTLRERGNDLDRSEGRAFARNLVR